MATGSEFMGLTRRAAQNLAESKGMIFRLISVDGEPYLAYPEDLRDDRICIEMTHGKVSRALVQ
jgi:hypothetical protein